MFPNENVTLCKLPFAYVLSSTATQYRLQLGKQIMDILKEKFI